MLNHYSNSVILKTITFAGFRKNNEIRYWPQYYQGTAHLFLLDDLKMKKGILST